MMLVDEHPLSGNLAESDGQTKIEVTGAAALDNDATHEGGSECHVSARGNVKFANLELRRLGGRPEEQRPSLLVSHNAPRIKRRRNVEHQKVFGVMLEDAVHVFAANSSGPCFNELADFRCIFVVSITLGRPHARSSPFYRYGFVFAISGITSPLRLGGSSR